MSSFCFISDNVEETDVVHAFKKKDQKFMVIFCYIHSSRPELAI